MEITGAPAVFLSGKFTGIFSPACDTESERRGISERWTNLLTSLQWETCQTWRRSRKATKKKEKKKKKTKKKHVREVGELEEGNKK